MYMFEQAGSSGTLPRLQEAASTSSMSEGNRLMLCPDRAVRCLTARHLPPSPNSGFLLFSVTIWGFLKLWLLHHHLPLARKMLPNCCQQRLLPASTHTTHNFYNTKQACKGAQKAWIYAQYFMKSHVLVSIHPFFSETTWDYSKAHLELGVLLPLCAHSQFVTHRHSRPPSYSGVNGWFTQGSTKTQTYPPVTSAGQKASFSKGFAIRPETQKALGKFWCPSMAQVGNYSSSQGLWCVHCKVLPCCAPLFHKPVFGRFLFAADSCNISHWGCNKMRSMDRIYGMLQIMKFNVIF